MHPCAIHHWLAPPLLLLPIRSDSLMLLLLLSLIAVEW